MKKLGILISLCIHSVYAVVSGLMAFGYWKSLENGSFGDAVPEGIGAVGLILLVLVGALFFAIFLVFCASVAAVLFELCDLIFDKRGFAFVYALISAGFLVFFGKGMLDMVMEAAQAGMLGTMWQSGGIWAMLLLNLSALVPTVVGLSRVLKKKDG